MLDLSKLQETNELPRSIEIGLLGPLTRGIGRRSITTPESDCLRPTTNGRFITEPSTNDLLRAIMQHSTQRSTSLYPNVNMQRPSCFSDLYLENSLCCAQDSSIRAYLSFTIYLISITEAIRGFLYFHTRVHCAESILQYELQTGLTKKHSGPPVHVHRPQPPSTSSACSGIDSAFSTSTSSV